MTLLIRMPQTLLDHDLSRLCDRTVDFTRILRNHRFLDPQQASTKRLILAGKIETGLD